jgi:hypothetical protein
MENRRTKKEQSQLQTRPPQQGGAHREKAAKMAAGTDGDVQKEYGERLHPCLFWRRSEVAYFEALGDTQKKA